MKRLNLDTAPAAIKKFLRSLAIDADGMEIELGGQVLCKIVPVAQLSEAENSARLAELRALLQRSRRRSEQAAPEAIERDIRAGLAIVHGKR